MFLFLLGLFYFLLDHVMMYLCQYECRKQAEATHYETNEEDCLQRLGMIINNRSAIVIDGAHDLDQEQQHAESNRKLFRRKPQAHDRLL